MNSVSLSQLGWKPFFQQQLDLDELENVQAYKILEHHRSGYVCVSPQGQCHLAIHSKLPSLTVGDWVLLDEKQNFVRSLERRSLFQRKAAGSRRAEQLIAANVDTVFIVCSLNEDFNLSRIERYLTLAHEAEVDPVIVLTKADLAMEFDSIINQVQQLDSLMPVLAVNALDSSTIEQLAPWCKSGQSLALLGSSGVGKSTLVNTLLQSEQQQTGAIREDDSKGRHTTTARSTHWMPNGALLIDTPGMRELQLTDCEQGVAETFSDIAELTIQCRFADCQHQTEPGCAILAALDKGEVDSRRVNNYFKLQREQARNSASLAERHESNRNLSKFYRSVQIESRQRKKGY